MRNLLAAVPKSPAPCTILCANDDDGGGGDSQHTQLNMM